MDTGGPSGFRNAPVTRVIIGTVSVTSLLWLTGVIKPHRQPSNILLLLAFPQLGSLIFGLALLYQFRSLERQSGTSKFASLVGLALLLQYLLLLVPLGKELPAGPFPLVFACLTLLLIETPAMQHFSIFGVRLTEKVFTQAAALQLVLSSPRSALLLMASGILLGALQHVNFMGMRDWKVPGAVSGRLGSLLAPLLQGDRQGHRTMVRPPQSSARPGSAAQRPLGQRPAARAPAVVASREGVEQLVAMGFSEEAARAALARSNNDVQAATSLLL